VAAQQEAEQRRQHDGGGGFQKTARDQHVGAALGDRGASQPADQRVRRTRRDAVVPGHDIPERRADEGAEHHVMVDDFGNDDALAYRRRDVQAEEQKRDEIEECRPHDGPLRAHRASRDDGRDRVRGVVKAVHEIEHERQQNQAHQHLESHARAPAAVIGVFIVSPAAPS
jgi:hypothetical protein